MKSVTRMAMFAVAPAVLIGFAVMMSGFRPVESVVQAANENILTFDVACDCRTGVAGPNRGDPFIINGKIFPAGTLPLGTATNDPTLPVNGVAPIGTWTCRGQNSLPFPPAVAFAYNTSPFAYFDWHFVLNDGRGLNATGYPTSPSGNAGALSVTGGIGDLRGAAGEIRSSEFGTNATGCPNFRAAVTFRPGSLH